MGFIGKNHFLLAFLFVKLAVSTLKPLPLKTLLTGVPCLRLQHYY